jgi:hypothetical protein
LKAKLRGHFFTDTKRPVSRALSLIHSKEKDLMIKRYTKRGFYWVLLAVAWALMGYSVLLGGFSTSLADYGNDGLSCTDLRGCGGFAGCANGGSVNGCTIVCTGGGTATCTKN